MTKLLPLEVYVRPRGENGSLHLNIHASPAMSRRMLQGLKEGSLNEGSRPVAFLEFSLMPEWLDAEERDRLGDISLHVRVPLTAINLLVDQPVEDHD